jgi:oligo-1,6-glucosidase
MTQNSQSSKIWWKEGIIYQIYPQSFHDSNGDGIGDLRGIIQKLDYIKSLGVDIIWLNPIYDSPLDDNGYDISDYLSINPIYGTMADFDEMLEEMHKRGLRLLMDLVINHSSDEHEWFKQSRSSIDNPYRNYYFWKTGKNGGPPNNWPAIFGGSVWEYDGNTNEYYLHLFSKKQPDLNWENPSVRKEISDIVRWWLDKGIDGFRLDVISMISKRTDFPESHGESYTELFSNYFCNGPRVHEYIQDLYKSSLIDYDVMTVGEGPAISKEMGNDYTGKDRCELSMIFPLDLMFAGWGPGGRFDPGTSDLHDIKSFFQEWNDALNDDGWMSIFLDNHDFPRMVSRFGNDSTYRIESAKLLLTLLLTLRGTPSIHYGSELGMTNVTFDHINQYKDIEAHNFYKDAIKKGMAPSKALELIQINGRDNVRTPMQWNGSPHGGFTTGTPWLGSNPNHTLINVETENSNTNSILSYFRKMTAFRKKNKTLIYGTMADQAPEHTKIYHYERRDKEVTFAIILNFSSELVNYNTHHLVKNILICNYTEHHLGKTMPDRFRPWEARIYSIKSD